MHEDTKKYKYEYFITYLWDGKFDKQDASLRKMLDEGWKPIRETPVGNSGHVIFVLSKAIE